jgi:hypothetical protein
MQANLYTRSAALPAKPVIVQAVSFGHDSASLKLATDLATNADAPIAFYTITINRVDSSTAAKVETKRIYSWRDLELAVTGLQGRTTYTFTVTATTVDGTSAVSLASLPVTTPAYVPSESSASSSNSSTVAAPAFTLSSTAETKTVNNAITGYTIASTGGTIASYAISPSAPAGTIFNTTTGLLSGTPTSTQSATSYTITATNTAGSSTGTFTLTITALVVGPASMLALSRSSVGTSAGVAFSTQPQVTVQDANGNTVTSSTAVVTATISSRGSLVGTTSATASGGVATFNNLGVRGFGGTAYTITYATTGLTSATEIVTPSAYALGATGPGGGKIYYIASNANGFACGQALGSFCFYLEVARNSWSGSGANDPTVSWAQSSPVNLQTSASNITLSAGIGLGAQHTKAIIDQGNTNPSTSAAARADSYSETIGGVSYDDWFLPSEEELSQLYIQKDAVGMVFNGASYWSSTSTGGLNGRYLVVTHVSATPGGFSGELKNNTFYVRPIRAF